MSDLISVIIPTHNCAPYLEEAIGSVLAQTYPHIEAVVVDDGSTDPTGEVLARYRSEPRVRTFRQHNQGVGAARNTGMRLSRGKYLCFLDADDALAPDSVRSRHRVLAAASRIALVFTDYALQRTDEERLPRYLRHSGFLEYFESAFANSPPEWITFNDRFAELFYRFSPHPIWTGTVMVRTAVAQSIGSFRTDISVGEDTDYWMRIAARHPIAFLDTATAVYNHHRSNLTRDPERYCRDRIKRLKDMPVPASVCRGTIRKNIGDAYFQLGYHYYETDRRAEAALSYLRGLTYDLRGAFVKGLVLDLLPRSLARGIRSAMAALR